MIHNINTINLQEGDILHCMSNGLLARCIHYFTKSKINHTALVLKIYNNLFISDSQIKGTYPIPLKDWTKKYKYKYIISRPLKFTKYNKYKAINRWGKTPYDFASLLFQAWYQMTGRWIGKGKYKAEKRMYCSEYVAYVFNLDRWWMKSPKDVYNTLTKSNDFITIKY